MNFGMTILNQSVNEIAFKTAQNYTTGILRTLSLITKLKMFMKTLLLILKKDLIYQIMKSIDH